MTQDNYDRASGGEIDPVLLTVLDQLWRATSKDSARPWSLARLAKQSGLPMSTLRRCLHHLQDCGLVGLLLQDTGSSTVSLTESGLAICREIFVGTMG